MQGRRGSDSMCGGWLGGGWRRHGECVSIPGCGVDWGLVVGHGEEGHCLGVPGGRVPSNGGVDPGVLGPQGADGQWVNQMWREGKVCHQPTAVGGSGGGQVVVSGT